MVVSKTLRTVVFVRGLGCVCLAPAGTGPASRTFWSAISEREGFGYESVIGQGRYVSKHTLADQLRFLSSRVG